MLAHKQFSRPNYTLIALVVIVALAVVAFILAALGVSRLNSFESINSFAPGIPADGTVALERAGSADEFSGGFAQTEAPVNNQTIEGRERVILRNATLTLTLENPQESLAAIARMADEMGGWVVSANTRSSIDSAGDPVTYGTITVRVPSERLDEALAQIKVGGGEVENESISGRDVTREYVDLSSRLSNLQAAEVQLQGIMTEARKVEDVLMVHSELTRIRGEIESIQGQLQFFDESAAFSSIQVTLNPVLPGPVQAQTAGWSPAHTAENALGSLVAVLQFIADVSIAGAIIVLPLLLIVALPARWTYRRLRPSSTAA